MPYAVLSEKAGSGLKTYLKSRGYDAITVKSTDSVYESIASHADIYVCCLGGELVIAREQLPFLLPQLEDSGISYKEGVSVLSRKYPGTISYNAAVTGKFLIHNLRYTDKVLLEQAEHLGLTCLHVNQGYTKCNIVVVSDEAVITSDAGIARQLSPHPIDVLLVQEGHVKLTGFSYGFLGGASGKIKSSILFNGDLSRHPDFVRIVDFIESKGLSAVYFEGWELEDIGSVIILPQIGEQR